MVGSYQVKWKTAFEPRSEIQGTWRNLDRIAHWKGLAGKPSPKLPKTCIVNTFSGTVQKHWPVVDRFHHPCAQPPQIGRDGTPAPAFFSVEGAEIHHQEHINPDSGKPKSTKPGQKALWAGF